MADDDEIDVLLAASDDGKSDWVLDSGSAYHLCRDREVFSTYAACEGRIWMANNTSSRVVWQRVSPVPHGRRRFDASGGILRVFKGNKEMLWGKKTGRLYRLEGNVQTGGATVRHGSSGISEKSGQGKQPLHRSTQSKRRGTWRIRSGTRAQGDTLGYVRKSGQTRVMQPVQDVHREAQSKETKSILRSCTAKGAATPKRSYGGAGSEVVRKDNLKTSDYPPVGWRGRLLSPAHLDESKPTWMSPSPVAKPKPDWSSYGVSM
ncbi:hypothetical protein Acr_20g0001330 [Actinidia rufa]|uniref:Retrovirus-related Pol polyprotein from transposon TNT 1-94-like beta-barrel domain-containing protein n=1 Tax=Actinidia rufa TaxID=165716 RepID=A0A7J0GBZ0_9ERIC|nr:hypothetical protein Acr_20g0001330 [Actinidia rufa]